KARNYRTGTSINGSSIPPPGFKTRGFFEPSSFQFEWQAVGERMRPVISFVGCVVDPENDPVRKVLLRRQGEKAGDNMFLFITHGDRHNS
ncbi:hypothetical protein NKW43_15650, partial [Gluconobacter albidus]|uniref:hypothetical protein n=1 Tax=Gluconobacter albidus TaxID=318683 RepID=UPI0020A094F9